MSNVIPRDEQWVSASQVNKTFRIGPHRLKSLALAGRIRTLHRTLWPSCLYSIEDVRRYQEEMTNPDGGPRQMVASAGIR